MSEIYLGTPSPIVVSWCEKKYPNYMTIECLEDGTNVNIFRSDEAQTGKFQVQLNDNDWTDVSWEDIGSGKEYNLINAAAGKSSMTAGDKLKFRNIDKWSDNPGNYTKLMIKNNNTKIYGKLINSLALEFAASAQTYKLMSMFQDSTASIDISKFDLANITLTESCYFKMFKNCTSLINTPAFSEIQLTDYCYDSMFSGCTSITTIPALPSTQLAGNCYYNMFQGCTSIAGRLDLPATYNTAGCYTDMFSSTGNTNTKEIHVPKSLSNEIDSTTFGDINGVSVIYDL